MSWTGKGQAIGIDLGTTYSRVGVWQNDRVEIIADDEGNRMTPSYVGFTDTERPIGNATNHQNTLWIIGKYAKPRCFKNVNLNSLNCEYRANKRAWMTGVLFEEYVRQLDKKMVGRKILLIVDNCLLRNEAIKAAITLNNFLLSYEKTTPEVLTMLKKIRADIQGEIDFNKKQKTIESFFKKHS
ncbi:hypothetical protein OSB04_022612 [Centaurea solstitialis]|uniref:Uncharacterized protein n=1 Tax=Centaurea solstitialis TaxID=347529 RepID=A0AA38WHF2_9ASTR|nr:hypothetical protein OSB04_022612 [Centaurea solstitialis]